jgi:hypothetical protein
VDLSKAILPADIEVAGRFYPIHTGHPYWFRFHEVYSQPKKFVTDFAFLYLDEQPEDGRAGVDALLQFFWEPREVPRSLGDDDGVRVLDYGIDAELIYAAILQCYGIDLYEKEWHWHKVRAMIAGLHGTKLNDILWYRSCVPGKNKELGRMKQIWALPERAAPEDKEAEDAFAKQFYGAQF